MKIIRLSRRSGGPCGIAWWFHWSY